MLISSSLWRLPVAKSLKSCAGVTFTAPVPNFGSTRIASVMIGIVPIDERVRRASCRAGACSADRRGARRRRCRRASSRGASSRRRSPRPSPSTWYANSKSSPFAPSSFSTSRSRERRAALGAPVDEARGAVDEPLLVEAHERLGHGARHVRVHRELGARPVGRRAEHALLERDAPAALGLPLPDALDERLAPEVVARLALALRAAARRRSAWRCRRDRCPAARARCSRACGASGRARPRACSRCACPMCSEPVTLGGGIGMT